MFKAITNRLQNRLLFAFLLVLLIPTAIISTYAINVADSTLTQAAKDTGLQDNRREAQQIANFLTRTRSDISFLSNDTGVSDYINAVAAKDANAIGIALTDIQKVFVDYSQSVGIYDQIRLLGPTGQEVVRINFTNGKAVLATNDELENAVNTDYFQRTSALPAGRVYTSALSLKVENGRLETPYKPIIRYAAPAYGQNGKLGGVIVTDLLADKFLSLVKGDNSAEAAYLIDSDGTYLAGPNPAQLFGRDFRHIVDFTKDFPNDAPQILAAKEGVTVGSKDRPDIFQVYSRVSVPDQPAIQWTLYHTQTISNILGDVSNARLVILALALIALLIAAGVALLVTRSIVRPVQQLATVAGTLSQGQWGATVTVKSQDEIGDLALAFNSMSKELKAVYGNLEERIAARTGELETVAKVSATAAMLLDPDELLQSVADLTKTSFNLYHAHIYLLDESGNTLELAAGAGEAGRTMKARGHSIPLNREHSLVARSARTHQAAIVNDVSREPDFLPNALLPDTKSEMAVPLVVGERLVGVLDVQSDQTGYFTPDEVKIKTTLADQIAVAVENARSFDKTAGLLKALQANTYIAEMLRGSGEIQPLLERVLQEVCTVFGADNAVGSIYNRETDSWQGYVGAGVGMTSAIAQSFADPGPAYPHGLEAVQTANVVIVNDTREYPDFPVAYIEKLGLKSVLVMPLAAGNVGNLPSGVFFLNFNTRQHTFTATEIELAKGLSDQISTSIQRRLAEDETRLRARELETVAQVSAATASILDADELLDTVSNLTKERFDLYHAHIYLLDNDQKTLYLAAGAGEAGRTMKARGHNIPLSREQSIVVQSALTQQVKIVNDVQQSADFLPNDLLPNTKSEMAVPMIAGNQLVGVLDVQANRINRFTAGDARIQRTLADQIAVAVENARAFAQTRRSQQRSEVLGRMNAALSTATNEDQLAAAAGVALESFNTTLISLAYTEQDENGLPEVATMVGLWTRLDYVAGASSASISISYRMAEIPFTRLYLQAPENILFIENMLTYPNGETMLRSIGSPKIGAMVIMPLYTANRWQGILTLTWAEPHYFTPNEREILEGLRRTMPAAVATRRAYLAEEAARRENEQRARELATVAEVSAATATILNVDELLIQVSDLTKHRFDLYHAHVYLYDQASGLLNLGGGAGEAGHAMKMRGHNIPYDRERSLVARAARTRQGVVVNNVRQEQGFLPNPLLPKTQSELAVPLIAGDQLVGVLDVQSERLNRFTDADVSIMRTLADQVAVAVDNARLFGEVERQQRTLNTLLDNLPVGVFFVDARTGVPLLANKAATVLLGRGIDPNAGADEYVETYQTYRGFTDEPYPQNELPLVITMTTGNPATANDITVIHPNGERVVLDVVSAPMSNDQNEMIAVVAVFQDITDRVALEDETQRLLEETTKLYEDASRTADKLREVDRLKSEFLASMSHELRTPLNSIIGYAEVLVDGIDGDLPGEAVEDVQAIHDSGHHLLGLINDILDLAKIEAGHMELDREDVALRDVMTEIKRITTGLLKDKSVEVVFDVPDNLPLLDADHGRLRQILNNLISNAIKFTDQGQIIVNAALIDNDSAVQISVRDSGIGIAPEHLGMVFEQFRQVDNSSTRKVGGTGLGLPITQKLVQMHGGTIWVESEVGVGSTFAFTIPTANVAVAE